jgi:hypothetical protein
MARKIYKGKNLRILIGGKSVLHATECNFSTTRNFESVATKDTNGNVQTPDNYEWNVSTNALFVDKDVTDTEKLETIELFEQYLAADLVDVQFTTNLGGEVVISGQAYPSGISIAAAASGSATGDFNFQGDGDFGVSRIPSVPAFTISNYNTSIDAGEASFVNFVSSLNNALTLDLNSTILLTFFLKEVSCLDRPPPIIRL